MSKNHFAWISCLCLGLALLAAPAMATEATMEVGVEEAQSCISDLEPLLEMAVFQVEPEPCDADEDEGCFGTNVWCCKPNADGTSQHCAKIKRTKCNAAPAGTIHASGNACNRAC